MGQVVARRALSFLPTMLATSVLVFFVLSMGPSPLAQLQEVANLSAADIARLSHRYGWDLPLWKQYLNWLSDYVRGDWGVSVRTFRPARDMIMERLPLTLTIASLALTISIAIGLPLGAIAAVRKDTRADVGASLFALSLLAMPAFFMALLLQLLAIALRSASGHVIFFTSGTPESSGDLVGWAQRLFLPVMTLALTHVAMWVRYQRGELLNVLGQQYINCARAKGLPERMIFLRHATRNALLPVVTLVGVELGKLVGGAVIIESVFGLPGIGTLLLDSVVGHDTVVVLDILMLIAFMMVVGTTLADLVYGMLDPRVRVDG
jgi:peptide/nickel transport system permease protein